MSRVEEGYGSTWKKEGSADFACLVLPVELITNIEELFQKQTKNQKIYPYIVEWSTTYNQTQLKKSQKAYKYY